MHASFLHEALAKERELELARQLNRAHSRHLPPPAASVPTPVTLRLNRASDDDALHRLAALESRKPPAGRCVVAEVAGTIVAALPLDGSAAFADPFARTAHLVPLLEFRAKQITGNAFEKPPRWRILPALRWSMR